MAIQFGVSTVINRFCNVLDFYTDHNVLPQEGVTGCRRVKVDFERLKALRVGDRLALLPGHGVSIIPPI